MRNLSPVDANACIASATEDAELESEETHANYRSPGRTRQRITRLHTAGSNRPAKGAQTSSKADRRRPIFLTDRTAQISTAMNAYGGSLTAEKRTANTGAVKMPMGTKLSLVGVNQAQKELANAS